MNGVGAATDKAWMNRVGNVVNELTGDHRHRSPRSARARDRRHKAVVRGSSGHAWCWLRRSRGRLAISGRRRTR